MIVQTAKAPSFNDLMLNLKSQFTDYAIYAFSSQPRQSIIVRKSDIIGAQITIHENEIMVEACYPNLFMSSLMSLLTASSIFPFSSWPIFEKKISDYLKIKYS